MPPLTEEQLQELLNQQFADDQGVASLLPSNVSPFFRMDATGGIFPRQDFRELTGPQIDFGLTYLPDLESNISTIQNPGAPQSLGFDTSLGVANEDDEEQVEYLGSEDNRILRGLASLRDFLPGGDKSILGILKNALNFRDSPMYRPATIGVGGYTPAQLNQMNALGGFYSEPMRAYRRSAKGLSNMLRRAAADKSFSNKRLRERFEQFGLDPDTAGGMIDSIKESSKTGYGGYGSRDAAASAAASGGRDYSSSPGAMAGDMEYGEE